MTVSVIDSINVRYVMTEDGEKSDVIIPVASWEALVDWIKGSSIQEDDGELKSDIRESIIKQRALLKEGKLERIPLDEVLQRLEIA